MIYLNPVLRDKKNRDRNYLKESKKFIQSVVPECTNTDWHYIFSMNNGIKKLEYISEEMFFLYIEPTLNKVEFSRAVSDKNAYDNYFGAEHLPKTICKISNNQFFNDRNVLLNKNDAMLELSLMDEVLVMKPAINSGGGKGVVVKSAKEIALELDSDKKYLKGSYIIQERVKQHPDISKFHQSSLNTCRIMTARVRNEIVVLGAIIRFGRNNKTVDNGKSGGIACGIDKYGNLSDHASDHMMYLRYERHPDSDLKFSELTIPGYEEIVAFCIKNHQKFLHFTFISWDIGIRADGRPVLIEYNLKSQEISWHQYFNGPLFGEYTDYFLSVYQKMKKYNGYGKA